MIRDSHSARPTQEHDPAGSTPLAGQSDPASATDGHRTHVSAGEGGQPSDMDPYRIRPKNGAMMMLGTIGLPVAIILLVLVVVLVVF